MADSGDGVNSTSSRKEPRGMLTDGPVTDPASSMKVNQAGLRSNPKSRSIPCASCESFASIRQLYATTVVFAAVLTAELILANGDQNAVFNVAGEEIRPAEMKSFDVLFSPSYLR